MLEYEEILTECDLLNALDTDHILNEVYFGKSKELLKIEKLLDEYRKKYMGMYTLIGSQANTDKLLIKINRLFEEQFGFADFALFVIDMADMNAFTFSINSRFDVNATSKKLVNAKSFKFNKDSGYAVLTCIFAGLIFNPTFTTEEVLGIILHEIGHNFYAALSTANAVFSSCQKAVSFVGVVTDIYKVFKSGGADNGTAAVNTAMSTISHYALNSPVYFNAIMKPIIEAIKVANARKDDFATLMYDCLSCLYIGAAILKLIGKIKSFITAIFAPVKLYKALMEYWLKKLINTVKDPVHVLSMPDGFRNERTADNFATMYGYGPALTDALRKMEMSNYSASQLEQLPRSVPIISCLFDALVLPFNMIHTALDPHPLNLQRTTDQIRMLDQELKKSNLDPKMKKRIQKDVDDMNNCLNKFIDTSKSIGSDPDFVKHVVNRIMYNAVDGKSVKDVIFNFDPNGKYKSYDKTIDEVCEKYKK